MLADMLTDNTWPFTVVAPCVFSNDNVTYFLIVALYVTVLFVFDSLTIIVAVPIYLLGLIVNVVPLISHVAIESLLLEHVNFP